MILVTLFIVIWIVAAYREEKKIKEWQEEFEQLKEKFRYDQFNYYTFNYDTFDYDTFDKES